MSVKDIDEFFEAYGEQLEVLSKEIPDDVEFEFGNTLGEFIAYLEEDYGLSTNQVRNILEVIEKEVTGDEL